MAAHHRARLTISFSAKLNSRQQQFQSIDEGGRPIMRLKRRTVLTAGAAAAAAAAAPGIFAQQSNKTGTGKFYERGLVRIYYEETGSGFPLLLIPGGGLNSTIAALANPF